MAATDAGAIADEAMTAKNDSPPAKKAKQEAVEVVDAQEDGKAKADFGIARTGDLGPFGFEYLDHTADIQIHSWGRSLEESFEQACVGMFGYMTELPKVEINEELTSTFEVEGHDMPSLLFALMDEFLFRFSAEDFMVCPVIKIVEFDRESFKIKVEGHGEPFDLAKHPQGTEIKAITYSAMQIHVDRPKNDVYVIVDI